MDRGAAQNFVRADVAARTDSLLDLSHDIWEHPELNFEEHHAHGVLTDALEAAGLEVERHAYGLETAFRAQVGDGSGPVVAICCEYDALPGIGHACGHNIIAAAGLGAGLAAAGVAEQFGATVIILGTPAEEGGGGKIIMAERAAFDGVDVAMMVHPADAELDAFHTLAVHHMSCEFHGHAAHAAAAPEMGRNALDAAVLAYQNVAALRQHIAVDERIHGIFTDGGAKPNIVPDYAAQEWFVRSATPTRLLALEERVLNALAAGASATGCDFTSTWISPPYSDMVNISALQDVWIRHLSDLGRDVQPAATRPTLMGSTDMGNVSYVAPSIHPMIRVAPDGVSIHTEDFADFALGLQGDAAVVDGALGLALTAVDLLADAALVKSAREEWAERVRGRTAALT
jgi:amidohydrolase